MWTVVYMTQKAENVAVLKNALESNGLHYTLREIQGKDSEECYEVLVPESDVNKAHGIIIESSLI